MPERLQSFAPTEIGKVDYEATLNYVPARIFDQPDGSRCRSSGRDEIVDHQHALAGTDCVHVHLDAVSPVFQLVIPANRGPGQFAALAQWNEAGRKRVREGRADDEAARFDRGNLVDVRAAQV